MFRHGLPTYHQHSQDESNEVRENEIFLEVQNVMFGDWV